MPLPFALNHINLWLLEDGSGWTIVDCGYALRRPATAWERIFAERLGGRPVSRVIVTHYHPDHIGLAAWLTERWRGAAVDHREGMAARADDALRHGDDASADLAARLSPTAPGSTRSRAKFSPSARAITAAACRRCRRVYHRIGDGMVIEIGGREWRVIVGEGHAPEHRLPLLRRDRCPDRRRSDPAANLAQYQRADLTSPTATRWRATSPRCKTARRAAARHLGAAVAQSAVLPGSTRVSMNSPRIMRRAAPSCSPPAPGR